MRVRTEQFNTNENFFLTSKQLLELVKKFLVPINGAVNILIGIASTNLWIFWKKIPSGAWIDLSPIYFFTGILHVQA